MFCDLKIGNQFDKIKINNQIVNFFYFEFPTIFQIKSKKFYDLIQSKKISKLENLKPIWRK